MTPEPCTADKPDCLTFPELEALTVLRNRYGDHRDVFTEHELARLQFVRWLYKTGRFGSRDPVAPLDWSV